MAFLVKGSHYDQPPSVAAPSRPGGAAKPLRIVFGHD
jgi:hypothetical protein